MSDYLVEIITDTLQRYRDPIEVPANVAHEIVNFLPVGSYRKWVFAHIYSATHVGGFVPAPGHYDRWDVAPDGLHVLRKGLLDSHVITWPVDLGTLACASP